MKLSPAIATAVLAFVISAFGQAGESQPQANQSSAAQPSGTPHHPMHRHERMHHNPAKMKEHMQEMQTHMKDMQSRVEKLRADALKVQDPQTRTALLDAVDIWEQMMSHMQKHMQGMMEHGKMDHRMMDHGGMHHMDMMGEEHEKVKGSETKPQ